MFWNSKFLKRIKYLEGEIEYHEEAEKMLIHQNKILQQEPPVKGSFADLMRESLGMTIDFSEADTKTCLPAHFLEGLTSDERKNFVSDMETIYANEKFQSVVKYMINLFALNMVFKADEEERKRNQAAVIAFRTLLREFDKMHVEFLESKRNADEDVDPQELL